jgi:hypothetical protein
VPDRTPDLREDHTYATREGVGRSAASDVQPAWLRRPVSSNATKRERRSGAPSVVPRTNRDVHTHGSAAVRERLTDNKPARQPRRCAAKRPARPTEFRKGRRSLSASDPPLARRPHARVASASFHLRHKQPNTGDKLRSGARVLPRRRGHEAALRPSNGAAESFVSFIPLFDRSWIASPVCVVTRPSPQSSRRSRCQPCGAMSRRAAIPLP